MKDLQSLETGIANSNPVKMYLFKVNKKDTRKRCKICSELTIKTLEGRQWRRSDVFIVNSEHILSVDCEQTNFCWERRWL